MPAPEYHVFKEEFDRLQRCAHTEKELRVRHDRSGRAQLAMQCLICGRRVGDFLSRSVLNGRSLSEIPQWDGALEDYTRQGVDEKRKRAWDEIKATSIAKRMKDYDDYLLSDAWAAKRQTVIERAGGVCEGCRQRKASQALLRFSSTPWRV